MLKQCLAKLISSSKFNPKKPKPFIKKPTEELELLNKHIKETNKDTKVTGSQGWAKEDSKTREKRPIINDPYVKKTKPNFLKDLIAPSNDSTSLGFQPQTVSYLRESNQGHKTSDTIIKAQEAKPAEPKEGSNSVLSSTEPFQLKEEITPANVSFPWPFHSQNEPLPEISLQSVYPFERLVTYDTMAHLFKSFVRGWSSRDYEGLEDVLEPAFLHRLKREMDSLPAQYSMRVLNLKTAKLKFDLYEIVNYYMSDANTNRLLSDHVSEYHCSRTQINNADVYHLSKRVPNQDPVCGIVSQFHFNVYTNMSVEISDSKGIVHLKNSEDSSARLAVHDFKVEILCSRARQRGFKPYSKDTSNASTQNLMQKHNLRVFDANRFMQGNPLLGGLDLQRVEGLSLKEQQEMDSVFRERRDAAESEGGYQEYAANKMKK